MKKIIILALVFIFPAVNALFGGKVMVDQLGYRVNEKKYVISTSKDGEFKIRNAENNKLVYEGSFTGPLKDRDSGDTVFTGDFSDFREEGEYYIETTGGQKSYKFKIDNKIHNDAFYKVMRGFYLQRCGTAVSDPGGFSHGKCHTQPAKFHPSTGESGEKLIPKGWHDAGDYGRYVVNLGLSTGTLLHMFERYGKKLKNFSLDIPESGNSIPDVLDEIRWNLEFMLSMQKYNGGVYHKVTTEKFPKMKMRAEDDRKQLYIYEITTTATADFAAVMAIAARVYRPYDEKFAEKCLKAAEKSWDYLSRVRKTMFPAVGFQNPEGTQTGRYSDKDDRDERLWAAAELFTTTNGDEYHKYFIENYENWEPAIENAAWWGDVYPTAMLAYAYSPNQEKKDKVAEEIVKALKSHADDILMNIEKNGYRYLLTSFDYKWGSNSVAMNYAINLLAAYELLKAKPEFNMSKERLDEYKQGALDALHYLLGRNPFNRSYVTGIGERYVMNIHHRPSVASGKDEPFPGLLAGGPNKKRNDKMLKDFVPEGAPPAKCYLDRMYSYASNEIAINWNAPLAYVLAFFAEDIIDAPELNADL